MRAIFLIYGAAVGAGMATLVHFAVSLHGPATVAVLLALAVPLALSGRSIAKKPGHTNLQRFALIPMIPFAIAAGVVGVGLFLGFFLLVGAVLFPVGWVAWLNHERKLRGDMQSKGRLLPASELRRILEAGEGTVIEEIGHKVPPRLWWTKDDVSATGSPPVTKEEFISILQGKDHAFNSYCLKEYLDPETGKAFLTRLPRRYVTSGALANTYPRMRVIKAVRPFRAGSTTG
jgi:hypothetical protein